MIRTVPAKWQTCFLVCGKCSRKLKGGFGAKGRTALAKLLRKVAGGKGRKAGFGVVETGCLKLCPKHAVVVVDTRHLREWLVVKQGVGLPELLVRLGLVTPAAQPAHVPPCAAAPPPAPQAPAD